ncbi:MAG TPA: hypothetical protein VLF95_10570 [Vicinamibacteria bacterium]|nr:hypothetical protein [Vicinamibacteria bacterium]
MTASHADLLPVGGELVLVGGQERSLQLAVAPVTAAAGRRPAPATADSSRAPDEPAAEENRMRLVAALLGLGTLLLWIALLKD